MKRLRAWWFSRQGLAERQSLSPRDIAGQCGWFRSVGSANPYLAIHSRTGASRKEIEDSVAKVELVQLPAARGCTYYVAGEDAAMALGLAAMGSCRAEFRMAERHLGVTEREVEELSEAILGKLSAEPLDPRAISSSVNPRTLGEAGKRRGMTSTLSLGLSKLQIEGKIRRLPHGGRLDTERFKYAIWDGGPRPCDLDEEALAHEVANLYFGWAGPASEKEFREFSGLPARLSKLATAELVTCPDDSSLRMRPDDLTAYCAVEPSVGRVVLLASLDTWIHARRNLASLLDPADSDHRIPYGDSLHTANALKDIDSHAIVMDGVLVGMWEFDHEAQKVVSWCWRPCEAVNRAIQETEEWIAKELGDFRSFSLDSPKSRIPRIELLRSLA